ncbi:VOC family protein [Rhodococcus sp. NPDC059234]|uniref:VOC family protein n=1 Tax=Rhodococcus sp. NPDC059234 TaxID=3346781 RepID=UPI00366E2C14
MTTTNETVRLAMVTIDCDDASALAAFYAELLGWSVVHDDGATAMIADGAGPSLGFGHVDGYTRPEWPDTQGRKQFHLDLDVEDIGGAERRALTIGAVRPEFQPGGDKWRVLLDPAGHPFCLAVWGG